MYLADECHIRVTVEGPAIEVGVSGFLHSALDALINRSLLSFTIRQLVVPLAQISELPVLDQHQLRVSA